MTTGRTPPDHKTVRVLIRLLRAPLRPCARPVALVVLLQLVQTLATLYLPTLNADIIDNGVVRGDTGYILHTGMVMLAVTLLQILCAAAAVYFGARTAMAVGRDVRAAIFGRVQEFSVREVGHFGAPSLITRTTNDVQQVQMLMLTTLTLMVSAPIMCLGGILMALNQDVPLSGLLLVIVPVLVLAVTLIIRRMTPLFRSMQRRIDRVNRVMREQITGLRVIRAFVRDEHEQARFAEANTELMDVSMGVGRLMALMFPTVMLVMNLSSVAVMWFGGHRIDSGSMQVDAGRGADRVPELPDADPHGGHDGDVHVRHRAAGAGVRRADPGGPRHPLQRHSAVRPGDRGPRPGSPGDPRRRVPLPRRGRDQRRT